MLKLSIWSVLKPIWQIQRKSKGRLEKEFKLLNTQADVIFDKLWEACEEGREHEKLSDEFNRIAERTQIVGESLGRYLRKVDVNKEWHKIIRK